MSVTNDLYHLILKDGLRRYKFKNSKHQNPPFEEQKGAVFCYRNKESMIAAKGIVMTSVEAVLENSNALTHWTPNVYRYGTYSLGKPKLTKGHSEDNLKQINTFFVDIDIKDSDEDINFTDILVSSLDLGFLPTLILKTDQGFQVYFVLSDAAYVTAESNFKVIKVAKKISQNIRLHYKKTLPVDMACNHFGIARIPREDNLQFLDSKNTYSFAEWMNWSMQQDDLEDSNKHNLILLSGTERQKQIDEPWYRLLKNTPDIKGEKSVFGRNNVIFTLSLACYSSGVLQSDCQEEMLEFNSALYAPLKVSELNKTINSAYSGNYAAASREYVEVLCETWIGSHLTSKDLFSRQGWYKLKKPREQRQRSHFSEWKEDVLAYIVQETSLEHPYLRLTKKTIVDAVGVPERSLDHVLKELQVDKKIVYSFRRGRGGGILIASVMAIALSLITLRRQLREDYYQALSGLLEHSKQFLKFTFESVIEGLTTYEETTLFELDTG